MNVNNSNKQRYSDFYKCKYNMKLSNHLFIHMNCKINRYNNIIF